MREHSHTELVKVANNWDLVISSSSKVPRLCSLHIVHIKHNGTMFRRFDECLSTQILHPNKRLMIFFGKTRRIPKDLQTKLQKLNVVVQCIRRWSTCLPTLLRHMQQQPTIIYFLLRSFSQASIFSHAIAQKRMRPFVGP